MLGRFEVVRAEREPSLCYDVVLVTPLLADPYTTEDLAPKTPPIRFDRAPDGRLLVPGRWWHRTFERTCEDPALSRAARALFALFTHFGDFAGRCDDGWRCRQRRWWLRWWLRRYIESF